MSLHIKRAHPEIYKEELKQLQPITALTEEQLYRIMARLEADYEENPTRQGIYKRMIEATIHEPDS